MKKMLTICAMIFGAFSIMVGTTSCKDKEECCEWTDDYGDDYKVCEEDGLIQNYSWDYIKNEAISYGGKCD